MSNTVYFDGNGREILEILKMALCGFKDVHITNAFLHPHHGLADEGRATLDIVVNFPNEKKWVDIHYHHNESATIKGGYGNISYIDHYYHLEPFPEDRIKKSKDDIFTWGYSYLKGDYILNEILERKKCKP